MNKEKIVKFIIILLFIFFIFYCFLYTPSNHIAYDTKIIQKMIKMKYSNYQIDSIELEYSDFFSTMQKVNNDHRASHASVYISNADEELCIELWRKHNFWKFGEEIIINGTRMPNEYWVRFNNGYANKENIEERLNGQWIIPNADGNLYEPYR